MSLFPLTFSFSDAYGRVTTRSFKVQATDFAAAATKTASFVTAYQGVTQLQLFQSRLMDEDLFAGVPSAGANIDEGMTISAQLDTPGKKASIQVPDPLEAIRNADSTIDLTDALMVAFLAEYTSATNFITASDGEIVASFIKATLDK